MALARKKSRRITIGGTELRWKVRSRPTYCQAMGWTPLSFTVQHASGSGARLEVSLPCAHPQQRTVHPPRRDHRHHQGNGPRLAPLKTRPPTHPATGPHNTRAPCAEQGTTLTGPSVVAVLR